MRILAIETSCDETSIAIVENGTRLLSLQTAGQEEYHRAFGGVVPEVAARKHLEVFYPTLAACLEQLEANELSETNELSEANPKEKRPYPKDSSTASLSSLLPYLHDIDALAVTTHPGLISSLFVGVSAAKNLAYFLEKPLIPVSHLQAHFYSLMMGSQGDMGTELSYPFIGLLVSGGHTILAQVNAPLSIEVLGTTLDDACGECFDKIARFLELPYPGGPEIEALAKTGQPHYLNYPIFKGKNTSTSSTPYSFSYSGLKTAVLYNSGRYRNPALPAVETSETSTSPAEARSPSSVRTETIPKEHIAASFQFAALTQLVEKTAQAAYERNIKQIGICGGVAANATLKTLLQQHLAKKYPTFSPVTCFSPPLKLCGDNAAMIGGLAYHAYLAGEVCEDIFSLTPSAQSFKKHSIL